jgi:hypothetical protein
MPGGLETGAAVSSNADSLTGTWTAPEPIYRYPQSDPSNPEHTPKVFCYAAKEHTELESKGNFTFTYACNAGKVSDVMAKSQLYHPIVVTLPIDKIVSAAKK